MFAGHGAGLHAGGVGQCGTWLGAVPGSALINLVEFKVLARKTRAAHNVSFWRISAALQFYPTASLPKSSWPREHGEDAEGCAAPPGALLHELQPEG